MDEVKKWLVKIEEVKNGEIDLSRDEDLSIALMNIISIEEHLYFTAMKTGNQRYLDMLKSVRELRKNLLKRIVTNPAGEEWCISKHLLAASMRLVEVGTKELSKKNTREANDFFTAAFDLHSLFFAINTGAVDFKRLSAETDVKENGAMKRFSAAFKKMIDCCKE